MIERKPKEEILRFIFVATHERMLETEEEEEEGGLAGASRSERAAQMRTEVNKVQAQIYIGWLP